MTNSTIHDLKQAIDILDRQIAECQDENGVILNWRKYEQIKLVATRQSFCDCIKYFEVNNINGAGENEGGGYHCEQCDREVNDNGPYEKADGEYECQNCFEKNLDRESEPPVGYKNRNKTGGVAWCSKPSNQEKLNRQESRC